MDVDDCQQGSPLGVDENLQLDEQQDVDPSPRRSKRQWKAKSFGLDFKEYLVKGTRNGIHSSVPYLLNVEGIVIRIPILIYGSTILRSKNRQSIRIVGRILIL